MKEKIVNKIVLFLGAGASKAFGLPLTGEIFPLIIEKINNKTLFDGNENEQIELQSFIGNLLPGIKKLTVTQYPMITDILSLLDHTIINGNTIWNKGKNKDLQYYRHLFEKAIFEVLDIQFSQNNKYNLGYKPAVLRQFTNWIFQNHKENYFSIVSTNYDIAVEQEVYNYLRESKEKIPQVVDFGVNWRDVELDFINLRPFNPKIGIFKLHGSTNWLKCNLCNHIYINTSGTIYHQAFRNDIDDYNSCDCGNAPLNSLIIAPSLAREIQDTNLPHIWNNALEQLRIADEWIIIGYSFPPEDLNIKSMFLRAFNGRNTKPKITVVQRGEEVKPRYEAIFDEIDYITGGLEKFIELKHKEMYQ
jgi:hypothetical protein